MSYHYKVASGYQAPRQQTTYGNAPQAYSVASSSTASGTTRERWHVAQAPTIHMSPASSTKEVRFLSPEDPASGYLYPGSRPRRSQSPHSQGNAYLPSPVTPSLGHFSDAEEDSFECPPTPLLRPKSLAPEDEPSLFDPRAHLYAAYAEIRQIEQELQSSVYCYQPPSDLDFESATSHSSVPALSPTARNRSYLEQTQMLERLQDRLDAIPSYGDEELRKIRKAVGAQVERALKELKNVQVMIWHRRMREQRKHRRV